MENKKRPNRKQFMIYLPDFIYNELKEICHKKDMTMTKYVVRALVTRMNMEREQNIRY